VLSIGVGVFMLALCGGLMTIILWIVQSISVILLSVGGFSSVSGVLIFWLVGCTS